MVCKMLVSVQRMGDERNVAKQGRRARRRNKQEGGGILESNTRSKVATRTCTLYE